MDDPFEAGVRIHDFKIMKVLGTGGMGIVYLANQTSLNRLVALKVLGPTIDDPKARARFRRESRAVALLKHPGIAEVHYAGQDDALCYMATEYIEGATLRRVLDRVAAARDAPIAFDSLLHEDGNGAGRRETRFDAGPDMADDPLTLDEGEGEDAWTVTPAARNVIGSKPYIRRCCLIARDAALALEHAHRKGVVHRDVKPQNLMLDRQGGVHVIDFGVARFRDDVSLSQTGALVGTPMYMSPEHISGRVNVDHRSDVFSLGIVLYEALTLRPPYSARTREGIFRQIVSKAMPPVSTWNRAVARPLEAVVHKAIARDPEERYPTAGAFAQDLQNLIDDRPIAARPYRYKFDHREVAAERPMGVIVAAFFVSSWGSSLTGLGLFMIVMTDESDLLQYAVFMGLWIVTFLAGIGMFWTARGLLLGKRMSITAAAAANLLVTLPTFVERFTDPAKYKIPLFNIISYLFMTIFALNIFLLYRPQTRRWFRLARALRSEYARIAKAR
jgi:serine/threonine protein kinase